MDKMEELSLPYLNETKFTAESMDHDAHMFMCHGRTVLDEHANELSARVNIRPLLWWDKECYRLSRNMKLIRQYFRTRNNFQTKRGISYTPFDKPRYTYKDYITARKTFKKYCRKVKRRFWRRFMANIPSTEDTAKLKKRLGRENSAS